MTTEQMPHTSDIERLPLGKNDPILQELWKHKAQINAESNYDVKVLAERARMIDVDEVARQLARAAQLAHI
jgi:hypothetical protein